MKISIALATYNGERYLHEQLVSLAEQTRLPDELVVTDDGSTDDTMHILDDFARHAPFPVRIYRNETRLGFADNFLKAASLCTGEWVAFCDQDDVWLPNKLERCEREFDDPSVVFIVHCGKVVDHELNSLGWQVPNFTIAATRIPLQGDAWSVYAGFASMIRRDILLLLNGDTRPAHPHFPGYRQSHDRWAYFLASVFGNTKIIPDSLVLYRQHETNTYGVRKPGRRIAISGRLGSNAAFLIRTALSAGAHADQLESSGVTMSPPWAEKAIAGAAYYRRLQLWLNRRAEIHDPANGFFRRSHALICNFSGMGYRSIERGGLGMRALVKDAVMCVVGAAVLNRFTKQPMHGLDSDREAS
jgi:glycosyltransferase involved in cell wall biosynthesis